MEIVTPDKNYSQGRKTLTNCLDEIPLDEDLEEPNQVLLKELEKLRLAQEYNQRPKIRKQRVKTDPFKNFESSKSPRLFLAHLGYLDYDQLINISQINTELANSKIELLDRLCEKEVYYMPIIYLSTSTTTDFLNKSCYSSTFKVFLQGLGIVLDFRHLKVGFLSHLKMALEKHKSLLYFSDCLHEILSVVSCLQKNPNLTEIVRDSSVVVVWNERIDDSHCIFTPDLLGFPELEHKICILVTPLKNNFVKVNFFPNKDQLGPLIDNMIIPLDILGKLLVYTLINTYGDSLEAVTTRKNRQDLLEQLELLGKNEESITKRFGSILDYSFDLSNS